MIWCNGEEVLWLDCPKLAVACGTMFNWFHGQSIITAGELIEDSPAVVTKITEIYKAEQEQLREMSHDAVNAYWVCWL